MEKANDLSENIRLKTVMISKARVTLADALIPKQDLVLVSELVTGPKRAGRW